jgi:hypothetical protein
MSAQPKGVALTTIANLAGVTPERTLELANKWHLSFARHSDGVFVDAQDVALWLGAVRHGRSDGDL